MLSSTERAAQIIAETSAWIDRVVIGLGLCPFAKPVQTKGLVRYHVSDATTESQLLVALEQELSTLANAGPELVDTTLLIHPFVLGDFLDYNDFLGEADDKLQELQLDGELQLASFHPEYAFAGTPAADPANYSNRSPYPMLHILREASVARAVAVFPDASSIYERNQATLRALPAERIARLIKG